MKTLHRIHGFTLVIVCFATLQVHAYFDPHVGRFASRDPIQERGGVNLYDFVGNAPVIFIDPYGLALYAFDGTGATYETHTHIAILHAIYQGNREYEVGVGTELRGPLDNKWIGGLTGAGGMDRVESMYRKFRANYAAGDRDVDVIRLDR